MAEEGRSRLGRGLAALIGDMGGDDARPAPVQKGAGVRKVPIEFVRPSPRNPRRTFLEEGLEDLTASVKEKGIIQPIVVRPLGANAFEIVAGERRWRAAQRAALHEVPVVVVELSDREALEVAIIENVQRSDLNPLEEAMGYELLIADHGYTQNDLGEIIGKSRSHVANSLRLLKLPEPVRDMLASGSLSAGHARALIPTSDPIALAKSVVAKGMSVRDTERLAQNDIKAQSDPNHGQAQRKDEKDADTLALERTLSDVLGLDVTVNHKGSGGQLRIAYKTLEQLEEICRLLERR